MPGLAAWVMVCGGDCQARVCYGYLDEGKKWWMPFVGKLGIKFTLHSEMNRVSTGRATVNIDIDEELSTHALHTDSLSKANQK